MSDFVVGKAYSERSNNVMQELLKMAEKTTPENMAKIIKERRKSMTVEELIKMLGNIEGNTEITADGNIIERVTADIDANGFIERVDLVLK